MYLFGAKVNKNFEKTPRPAPREKKTKLIQN
jgi:hypothetical protein